MSKIELEKATDAAEKKQTTKSTLYIRTRTRERFFTISISALGQDRLVFAPPFFANGHGNMVVEKQHQSRTYIVPNAYVLFFDEMPRPYQSSRHRVIIKIRHGRIFPLARLPYSLFSTRLARRVPFDARVLRLVSLCQTVFAPLGFYVFSKKFSVRPLRPTLPVSPARTTQNRAKGRFRSTFSPLFRQKTTI